MTALTPEITRLTSLQALWLQVGKRGIAGQVQGHIVDRRRKPESTTRVSRP